MQISRKYAELKAAEEKKLKNRGMGLGWSPEERRAYETQKMIAQARYIVSRNQK